MKAILAFLKGLIPANIKYYLIGAGILFVLGLIVTVKIQSNAIQKRNANITRLELNYNSLMDDNNFQTDLVLKKNEVIGQIKRERDSLAKELKIKPKQVEKIITVTNSIHDTVKIAVPAKIIGKNEWNIRDSSECLKIAYDAKLQGDSLIVKRELLEYNNQTVETFYRVRPHKFLFIHFGKWIYKEKIDSKCGETSEKNVTFVK